jgi:hypothetical protein
MVSQRLFRDRGRASWSAGEGEKHHANEQPLGKQRTTHLDDASPLAAFAAAKDTSRLPWKTPRNQKHVYIYAHTKEDDDESVSLAQLGPQRGDGRSSAAECTRRLNRCLRANVYHILQSCVPVLFQRLHACFKVHVPLLYCRQLLDEPA